MSSRTGGAAVAVSARTVGRRGARRPRPARGSRGGSRGPTRDTQWASSTTNSDGPASRSRASTASLAQLLGREQDVLELAVAGLLEDLLALALRQRRVQQRGLAAPALDLVALQRDQRRDDDRRRRRELAGDLVDRRLARAGRHDGQRVAARRAPPRSPRVGRAAARGSRSARGPRSSMRSLTRRTLSAPRRPKPGGGTTTLEGMAAPAPASTSSATTCPTARASTCSTTPRARSSTSARRSRSASASPATSPTR